MRYLLITIFFTVLISCQSQSHQNKAIEIFEKTIGYDNVEVFNKLIPFVENKLMQTYNVSTPDDAYKSFLKDVKKQNIYVDLRISSKEMEDILLVYERNKFRSEIWNIQKKNTRIVLDFNITGKYLKAFAEASKHNEIALNYYSIRNISGGISYVLVADALLKSYENMDNYFIKRIIIADFYYMNLINTNKYDLKLFSDTL